MFYIPISICMIAQSEIKLLILLCDKAARGRHSPQCRHVAVVERSRRQVARLDVDCGELGQVGASFLRPVALLRFRFPSSRHVAIGQTQRYLLFFQSLILGEIIKTNYWAYIFRWSTGVNNCLFRKSAFVAEV